MRALALRVDFLLLALDLGQLGRRAAELLGHGGQAVFQQLGLLLLLGQQGLPCAGCRDPTCRCATDTVRSAFAGRTAAVGTGPRGPAAPSDCRHSRPERSAPGPSLPPPTSCVAWQKTSLQSTAERSRATSSLHASTHLKEGCPVTPTAMGGPDVSKPLISRQEQFHRASI